MNRATGAPERPSPCPVAAPNPPRLRVESVTVMVD